MKKRVYILIISAIIAAMFLLSGCSASQAPIAPRQPSAPVSNSVAEIQNELKQVRARERVLEGALEDARVESAQTKLWVGAGTCFLGALVLIVVGVWTGRRTLIEFGILAGGLGGLLLFAAWLAPYALWIGIGIAILIAVIACYMIWNRDKALRQTAKAVDKIKEKVPEWRGVFQGEIDTMQDKLIKHIRGKKPA